MLDKIIFLKGFAQKVYEFLTNIRSRNVYMLYGTLVVFLLMVISDPDLNVIESLPFGAEQLVLLTILGKSILYATLLHITRKAFLDYDSADFDNAAKKSLETATGAGLLIVGIGLMTLAFSIVIALASVSR